MGGYTSKCENKSKSLHPTVYCSIGAVQIHWMGGGGGERKNENASGIKNQSLENSVLV